MKIFLATSFSAKVDANGKITTEFRDKIEKLIRRYETQGHKVFCAARAENWQIAGQNPSESLKLDLKSIRESDELMALIDNQISAGVQLEIGYALALGKKVCLITEAGEKLGWTNQALLELDNVRHEAL